MKIKVQTRNLAAGCSKHCFEVVDKTDVVSSKHCFEVVDKTDVVSSKHCFEVADKTNVVWRDFRRVLKHKQKPPHQVEVISFINTVLSHEGQLGRLGCMGCDGVWSVWHLQSSEFQTTAWLSSIPHSSAQRLDAHRHYHREPSHR